MSFDLDHFVRIRPFAFHLTSADNLLRIRRERRLHPALDLIQMAGQPDLARTHRPVAVRIEIEGDSVHLRDQAPLKRSNVTLDEAWTFGHVVELLNRRVFFWPGQAGGPIPSGQRHFERYAGERVKILRVPTRALFAANPALSPEFCKWNSGAPRWSGGIRPVRGPDTFHSAGQAPYGAAQVVELTFPGSVVLPQDSQIAETAAGPWSAL
ncbi:MAG TPA: hypothetical protein VF613_12745 [Longimicrobium sp.]|jgi:hypothetical protein